MAKENVIEMDMIEEAENKGIMVKAKQFAKQHGKKILAGAGIVTAAAIGYVVGKNSVGEILEVVEDCVPVEEILEA